MENENVFDFADEQMEIEEKQELVEKSEYVVEALQIVKIVKNSGLGGFHREIVDTIKCEHGIVPYTKAINRAKTIGSCMVVEKLERTIFTAS